MQEMRYDSRPVGAFKQRLSTQKCRLQFCLGMSTTGEAHSDFDRVTTLFSNVSLTQACYASREWGPTR